MGNEKEDVHTTFLWLHIPQYYTLFLFYFNLLCFLCRFTCSVIHFSVYLYQQKETTLTLTTMTITKTSIDGQEFSMTIVKFTREEVLECIDLELNENTTKLWDFENADCANPKTKAQKIKDAESTLDNMIEDYEYDNDLRD